MIAFIVGTDVIYTNEPWSELPVIHWQLEVLHKQPDNVTGLAGRYKPNVAALLGFTGFIGPHDRYIGPGLRWLGVMNELLGSWYLYFGFLVSKDEWLVPVADLEGRYSHGGTELKFDRVL